MRGRVASVSAWAMIALVVGVVGVRAQMAVPDASAPDGAKLFKNQCATCHTLHASDAQRQGPTMEGIYGRHAGAITGFHYSPGLAKADWNWDDAHVDTWLTNPQAMVPGSYMQYKQSKPEVRAAIIAYLKDLH